MHFLEKIISLYAPHVCVGCQAEGAVLCADCATVLPPSSARCYRCHQTSIRGRTCADCQAYGLEAVGVVTPYIGVAKDMVWRLKFERARSAADSMAAAMAALCRRQSPATLVVPVPTAPSRVRPHGYDQAVLLARAIARKNGQAYAPLLVRTGRQRQVGAGREQRRLQMHAAFQVRPSRRLRGAHIILVDDVITTGATFESAARTLRAGGARSVEAVAFAQAQLRLPK